MKEQEIDPIKVGQKVKLPSGTVIVIKKGLAKHAINAGRICDGDQSKYVSALISELVTFDGKKILMEDIGETVGLADYSQLIIYMGELNFI